MDEGARVKVGEIVADRYRVDRVLGQGAMGVVVAATHVELQQTRAIKFMLPETLDDKESVERFLREARAAAKLTSPHAVKVHDVARLPTGEPYIVMEYLQGTDLKKYLAEKRVLPIPEAVSYILQACDAIAEAHAAGIVHRDLKPANLFLAERAGAPPTLKVLDFGIAKVNDNPSNDGQLTATQTVIGSPLYMSPEQILSTRSVDARSDVWSLGVILYVLVTGMVPFRGDSTLAIFASVQRDDPVPPSMWMPPLPRDLERIILSCLEKDLSKRCPSARDLAAALVPFGPGASQGAGQNRAPAAPVDVGGTQRMTPALASASRPPAPPAPQGAYSQQPASQGYSNSNRFGSTQALSPGASYPAPPGYPPAPPYPQAGGYSPHPPPPSYPKPGYPPAGAGSYAPASVPGYAPAPGSYPHPAPQSYSQAGAQTNSPMTQPVVAPPRGRGRELLLIGGGFATALVIVGAVVIVSGGGNSKEPASNTPETAAAPAPSPPPVSADPPAGAPSVTPSSPETPPESPSGAAKAGSPPSGPATAAKPIGPATTTTTTKPPSAPAPSPPPAATQKPAPTSTTGAPLRKRHD